MLISAGIKLSQLKPTVDKIEISFNVDGI